ncbi:hypothetical protein [Virgibacillus sediminis]|uniref:Lipoyl-binding domain-containing protein n=1 Tax=Virgibacillus sediminis TaxID=202260 RepID=A0ABV7A5D2_9BACI
MKEVFHTIYSPSHGTVEKVFIQPESYVYEWEKLFLIRSHEQKEKEVCIGVSGTVSSVEISVGQEGSPDTPLAIIKDDLQITGSD